MHKSVIAMMVLLVSGLAGFSYWQNKNFQTMTQNESTGQGFGELQQALDNSSKELAQLRARVARLEQQANIVHESTWLNTDAVDTNSATSEIDREAELEPAQRSILEKLALTGMSDYEAVLLKEQWDEYQLKRLYLVDALRKDHARDKDEYRNEIRENEAQLRNEMGELNYDRMLYALGKPNRVRVNNVLGGSKAQHVGLREGDIILSYGGRATNSSRELVNGIRDSGDSTDIPIKILRGEEYMQFYVESGPLGVEISSVSVAP